MKQNLHYFIRSTTVEFLHQVGSFKKRQDILNFCLDSPQLLRLTNYVFLSMFYFSIKIYETKKWEDMQGVHG